MRKKAPRPDRSTEGVSAGVSFPQDLKNRLPPALLAEVGAVCLIWNVVEDMVDALLRTGLDISPSVAQHVTSRINGLDGKTAIIKELLNAFPPTPTVFQDLVTTTLNGVSECKRFRDGVVHARLHSQTTSLAYSAQRQGRVDEIVFTREALSGLYDRLAILDHELRTIRSTCDAHLFNAGYRRYPTFVESGRTIREIIQSYVKNLQEYQAQKKSLPPMPTVDSIKAKETEYSEGVAATMD